MAYPVSSIKDNKNKISSDIFSATKGAINPSLDPFYNSVTESLAKIVNSFEQSAGDQFLQRFAQTATTQESLSLISYQDTKNFIQRKEAKFASGQILVIASTQTDIPVGTQFITEDGNIYQSITFVSCVTNQINISSLTRSSNVVTAVIPNHNLGNLMTLTVSGATPSSFNGSFEITIIDKNTIRWDNEGDDESASGDLIGSFLGARVNVQAFDVGEAYNKDFNNSVDLAQAIDNITASYICFNGITGGLDIESLESWKNRLINYFAFPENAGNLYYLNNWILQNTNANYCYCFNSEDAMYLYLTGVVSKINSDYSITAFSSVELEQIKSSVILNNRFSLSGVDALQFAIVNPTLVSMDISISGLSPNTIEMKNAIQLQLRKYLALLPIKFFLKDGQISNSAIESVIRSVRDSSGRSPIISSASISGTLSTNTSKTILGTISY